MSYALLKPGRLIAVALTALSLLLLGQPPAHAGTWGTPQKVNSWNTVNGRWTPNNELETYTPNCVWYEGDTLIIKTYKASDGTYYSGRVESKKLYGYGTYSFTANMKAYTTPAGTGMHFIVNTAVGGDWPGNPNDSTWATADGARYLKVSSITYTPYTP
ncbi:hypothetical protein ACF07B_09230 [Streptomyces sp. NPDC015532]|uniref:hypothetical protein n=1 Tax=Streptomyces sp. NPDC015532 TaxID=3364960 RepID=UPI0036F65CA5